MTEPPQAPSPTAPATEPDAPALLAIEELGVRYPGRREPSLEDVTVSVEAGEQLGVAGRTGAGKSTLALAAAGFIPRVVRGRLSGHVAIGGLDTATAAPAALLGRVGIVFATPANQLSASKLTVREELAFGLENLGVPRAEMDARIDATLGRLSIGHLAEREPFALSGGEQQRVAIARALCLDPPLLLADEPTAHLDELQVEGVLRLLRDAARPGRAVVVATHDDRLLSLADQVVELTPRRRPTHRDPERVELPAGQILFEQGDEGDVAYVVESGEIQLLRERAEGGEDVVQRAGPGYYFGELAPLFGMRRTATARAAVDSVVNSFTPHDLRSVMARTAAARTNPGEA